MPLINDLSGKIAAMKNTCQFGVKILNAQKAGAIAAIIINREPGFCQPGDSGALCTIPTIFLDSADGFLIANEMKNGPVRAFMGASSVSGNIFSCDSVVTLDLTINQSTNSSESQLACDSAIWNGNTYYTSGTYYDTLNNAVGCDSIVTLNLLLILLQ